MLQYRNISSVGKVQGRTVIIGSGWAGFKLIETLDQRYHDVVVISPRNYFLFTPLLASTCVGTLEFRSIIEPIRKRQKSSYLKYYEALVTNIDIQNRKVYFQSVLDHHQKEREPFKIDYDQLIIACGAVTNTFNTPGVSEYAHFLKDINDARRIRYRILECFERSCQPGISEDEQKQLLHFVTVGGGPTGVEFSAELHDFITEDLAKLYPLLMDKVQLTLVDIAPKILSTFDMSLSDYTTKKFARKGIQMRTGTRITRVDGENHNLILQDGSNIKYGLLVWVTGLSPNGLLETINSAKCSKSGRLITDGYFRVLDEQFKPIQTGLYAIGDCASIKDNDLPCTAQVAKQKAKYLGRLLNSMIDFEPLDRRPVFSYKDMGSMAYIGQWRAIAGLPIRKERKWNEAGIMAWILWRSAYFTMSVSIRNKILIPIYWCLAWLVGRDVSHLK